jgi:hypothetical protein
VVSCVIAFEARGAEGRCRRAGRVRVESVYDSPFEYES